MKAPKPHGQTEAPPTKETSCAIYVTYHPDGKFPERIARIAPQVAHIVIVDNHSSQEATKMLRTLCGSEKIELIENKENLGVATALNQGVWHAIELGYAWALTLDQDSWPEVDLVTTLSAIYATHPDRQKVKMLGSNYRSAAIGYIAINCDGMTSEFVERKAVITSGSLMSLQAFEEIGQFRDDFFIDQVDDEYCLRLRAHGYKVLISCKPLIIHSIGNEARHKLLWKQPICSNQPPLRKYYITRNRVILYRKYVFKEPIWAIQSLHALLLETLMIILLEDKKKAKLTAIMLGIYHALRNYVGKMEDSLLEK